MTQNKARSKCKLHTVSGTWHGCLVSGWPCLWDDISWHGLRRSYLKLLIIYLLMPAVGNAPLYDKLFSSFLSHLYSGAFSMEVLKLFQAPFYKLTEQFGIKIINNCKRNSNVSWLYLYVYHYTISVVSEQHLKRCLFCMLSFFQVHMVLTMVLKSMKML